MDFFTSKTKSLWQKRNKLTSVKSVGIEVYYYSADKVEKHPSVSLHDINPILPEWATNMWINIEGIDEIIIHKIATTFHLHPLAIEDVIETDSRPKLDWYENSLFLVTHIVTTGDVDPRTNLFSLLTEQVSFFLIGNTLITIQEGLPGDIWQSVRNGLEIPGSSLRRGDAAFLLYVLLVGMIDTCDPIIDDLGELLEDLEMEMLSRPTKRMNRLVYLVKRHLMTLRTTLLPTRKIIQKLIDGTVTEDTPHIDPHNTVSSEGELNMSKRVRRPKQSHHTLSQGTITYFRDLLSELTEMSEKLEHQRELSNSLSGLYAEHQAQTQGDVSYAIALVSVFFLPLTFVAGVYGMNFEIMPELTWNLGYLYVWMIFIGIVLFEMGLFWKVGWITFGSRIDRLLSCKNGPRKKVKKMKNTLSVSGFSRDDNNLRHEDDE